MNMWTGVLWLRRESSGGLL